MLRTLTEAVRDRAREEKEVLLRTKASVAAQDSSPPSLLSRISRGLGSAGGAHAAEVRGASHALHPQHVLVFVVSGTFTPCSIMADKLTFESQIRSSATNYKCSLGISDS